MKKIFSYLRWIGNMLLSLYGFITAPIIFPILYPFRNTFIRYTKPFWYYFDDEDGVYGAEYWRNEKNLKKNFFTAYRWSALRNPTWNLQASLVPPMGEEEFISMKGFLKRNNITVPLSEVASLHYVNKDGKWTFNVGDYLSLKYSTIGKAFVWYTIEHKLFWRFSTARKVLGSKWIEIQLGTTERHIFKVKLKSKVKIYEEQSF